MSPAVVHTCHFHARPRLFNTTSKIGNSSGITGKSYPLSLLERGKRMPVSNHKPDFLPAKSI
jgi:hypothetical protein